jgi:hypothetical protein
MGAEIPPLAAEFWPPVPSTDCPKEEGSAITGPSRRLRRRSDRKRGRRTTEKVRCSCNSCGEGNPCKETSTLNTEAPITTEGSEKGSCDETQKCAGDPLPGIEIGNGVVKKMCRKPMPPLR